MLKKKIFNISSKNIFNHKDIISNRNLNKTFLISNNITRNIDKNSIKKSQNNIKYQKYIKNSNNKKNICYNKFINNLNSTKYIKSLNFALNPHIEAINTQFRKNNNYSKYYINNGNNIYKLNINSNRNIISLKNGKIRRYPTQSITKNNENNIMINQSKTMKYHRNNSLISDKKTFLNKSNDFKEYRKYINAVKIQSSYRGHIYRYKNNNILRILKLILIFINKMKLYKRTFFNNLTKKINKKIIFSQKISKYINKVSKKNSKKILKRNKSCDYMICNKNNININSTYKNKNSNTKINNIINYTICNINNLNINNNINRVNKSNISNTKDNNYNNINNNEYINSLINEKRLSEEKIKKLNNENINLTKKIKEINQKNEDKYKILNQENKNLNSINNDISIKNQQLLNELNSIKEKYENLLKKKNLTQFNITKQSEINIKYQENNDNENNNKNEKINKNDINDNISVETTNNINDTNNNNMEVNDIGKKINIIKTKEKCFKRLVNKSIDKYKEYLRKNFARFYYNGIYLQMTGKLKVSNNKLENNKKIEKNELYESRHVVIIDDINKEKEKKEEEKTEEEKKKEEKTEEEKKREEELSLKERIRKSRSIRKLLVKKAKEKMDTLKHYFYRFYRAGIISKFRRQQRRRSCIYNNPLSLDTVDKLIGNNNEKLLSKEIKEKNQLKEKTVKMLGKIIFKKDRDKMVILNNNFKKFYLKAKLLSIKTIIDNDKDKPKKKKKSKKKRKESDEKDKINENINEK